ncbi:MAG: site-specific integrase [Methanomicrobiaceae archaeon]|nr:site-specific integrase [Methanomicrobiaceae archaeon]
MSHRIADFISLQGNKGTRSSYASACRRYLDFIYEPVRKGRVVTQEEARQYEALANAYFTEPRNYALDLQRYAASLNASKSPPKSAQFWLAVLKEFSKANGIEIADDVWKATKKKAPKGRLARTREATFSRDLIQKIVPYMPVQTKAVFLTMLSSGMRIGETLLLRMEDIHLDEEPARIAIPGDITKSGDPRTTFISREAAAAVRAWLEVRDKWLTSSVQRNNGLLRYHGKEDLVKVIDGDDRIFPVHPATLQYSFANALKKAGVDDIDPKTNRRRVHLHQCRKFFRTVMAQRIPIDVVELLIGHNGYLADAYVRYTEEDLRQHYLQAEGAVCVGVADDVAAAIVGGHLDELREENDTLRAELAKIQRQIATVQSMQADVAAHPEALQALIDRRVKAALEGKQ